MTVKVDLSYLGIKINDKSLNVHTDSGITSCRRAFLNFQCAGLCKDGVSPKTDAELWKKVCNPVLIKGCEAVNFLTAENRKNLNKLQAKFLVSLDLPITARTTPLLDALKVSKVSDIVDDNVLFLKNVNFYCYILNDKYAKQASKNYCKLVCRHWI